MSRFAFARAVILFVLALLGLAATALTAVAQSAPGVSLSVPFRLPQ